jgi:diguanylate cyclase (GGDEF)-like protein
MEHRLARVMADPNGKKTGMYVLLLDLTHFKRINDTLRTDQREQFLHAMSARLQLSVRRADTVAHIRDGEFVIFLPGVVARLDAQSIANAILLKLQSGCQVGRDLVDLGACMGGASFPNDGTDVKAVFEHAESALNAEKSTRMSACFRPESLT